MLGQQLLYISKSTGKYGGNKRYNYGFVSGTANYCHKKEKWVADLKNCPKQALQVNNTNKDGATGG